MRWKRPWRSGRLYPTASPAPCGCGQHRFVRGGWKFHRCLNPACGKVYPLGEERCSECDHPTAPLYLCRSCGADYLRVVGDIEEGPLRPSAVDEEGPEWMICQPEKFDLLVAPEDDDDDEADGSPRVAARRADRVPDQIRQRPVLEGLARSRPRSNSAQSPRIIRFA